MKVMKKLLSVVLIAACVLPSGCLFTKKEKKYDFADTEWRSDDDSYMTISKKNKFAWILEDGEFLDMCNMYTGTYYPFEKI